MRRSIRIGVATTGGDAPGMNACVRAVVKSAPGRVSVVGIRHGGLGLLRDQDRHQPGGADYTPLSSADVSHILNRSGTVLKTARESRLRSFIGAAADANGVADITRDDQVARQAAELAGRAVESNRLDGLILIGGDTTCRAATMLHAAINGRLPIVVVPATIDNDIRGTVQTIGFDSALAMAVTQVDAIRETASSMDRLFVVEVMGRSHGHLAVELALASGAEAALVPERTYAVADISSLAARLAERVRSEHVSALVIVAEGAELPAPEHCHLGAIASPGQVFAAHAASISDAIEVRVSILGHTLRGAPPTAFTRNLATRAGLSALQAVLTCADEGVAPPHPILLGMDEGGRLSPQAVTGDMVRDDRAQVLEQLDEVEALAFGGARTYQGP